MEYKEHYVEWNDDKVGHFWDFQNNYEPFQDNWFTKLAGDGILGFIEKYIDIKGNVLDYGAGKGFLSVMLANKYPINHYSCDFSEEAIKYNNNLLVHDKNTQ